jgi:hypothetical protein
MAGKKQQLSIRFEKVNRSKLHLSMVHQRTRTGASKLPKRGRAHSNHRR